MKIRYSFLIAMLFSCSSVLAHHSVGGLFDKDAFVKDYQMPADEQELTDCIIAWGRRQIILRGGNRGVEAAVAE
jgi:hypothetical protein